MFDIYLDAFFPTLSKKGSKKNIQFLTENVIIIGVRASAILVSQKSNNS